MTYDIIGKLETFSQDTAFLIEAANLTGILNVQDKFNEIKSPTQVGKTEDYFAQLPSNVVLRLYEMYKVDFEMFGYSAEGYL